LRPRLIPASAQITDIVHVVATLNHGGTEVICRDLARAFRTRWGVRNHIVAMDERSGSIRKDLQAEAASPITDLSQGSEDGRLRRVWRFRALCKRVKPQAVLIHFFNIDHVALALAARWTGVPTVVAIAGNPAPSRQAATAAVVKWKIILALSRLVGVPISIVSHWIEDSLKRLGRLPRGSRVIHNGLDLSFIASEAAASRRGRSEAKRFVIGMVARLDPIKDHATLLSAVRILRDELPDQAFELRLVGDGPLRQALEERARSLGIADLVRFLGNRNDVPAILGELDLFVLSTTRDEGFGIVLIEALAAGLPVIASDVAACREVLDGGKYGRLVRPGDPRALAAAMKEEIHAEPVGAAASSDQIQSIFGLGTMAEGYWAFLMGQAA
jgi:glycosyltransferase involved in cell wall biosynthesis